MPEFIKLNSGLPIKQAGGSIAGAGTGSVTSRMVNVGSDKLASPVTLTYPKVQDGVQKSLSAGTFANDTDSPINYLTTSIADQANTSLAHGKMTTVSPNMSVQYERYHITSMAANGTPTYGGSRGVAVLVSGQNGVTGKTADQTLVGEFNYTINGHTVVNADY